MNLTPTTIELLHHAIKEAISQAEKGIEQTSFLTINGKLDPSGAAYFDRKKGDYIGAVSELREIQKQISKEHWDNITNKENK